MANIVRRIISSPLVAKPIAPYSQGVQVGNTLYVSGQVGMDLKTGDLVPGGVANEAKQALENIGHILKAAGTDMSKVVKTTVLLADMKDFETVNAVYAQYFKERFPARACYAVACLPKNCRVEIEAIAIVGNIQEAQ